MPADIEVRPGYVEDLNFIFATWLRSYRHASQFARKISNEIFYSRHHLVIDLILKRNGSKVLVAHPKGEPDVILGYVVTETQPDGANVLHYSYVKKSFRQMGIAKALWKDMNSTVFTHHTADADWIAKKFNLVYDPYRI
jgi:ribosomal protein S18 acetylase RimI-like enzyme